MKDVFIGLILTLVLIAFFSSIYTPFEPVVWGSGDKKPGDSDMVLPGKGAKPAESMSESPQNKTEEKTDSVGDENDSTDGATADKTESVAYEVLTTEKIKEEHNKVDGLMLAFWHGVGAVLIGEASALLVALAWSKIRGGKDG